MRIAEQMSVYASSGARRSSRVPVDAVPEKDEWIRSTDEAPEAKEDTVRNTLLQIAAARKKDPMNAQHELRGQADQALPVPDSPELPQKLTGHHVDLGTGQVREPKGFSDIAQRLGARAQGAAGAFFGPGAWEETSNTLQNAAGNVSQEAVPDLTQSVQRVLADLLESTHAGTEEGEPPRLRNLMRAVFAAADTADATPSSDGAGGSSAIPRGLRAAVALYMSITGQAGDHASAKAVPSEIAQMSPDSRASRILSRVRSGMPLSRADHSYIVRTRPDQAGLLSKVSAERDALTQRMRKARSKSEVRMVHLGAVVAAGKTSVTAGEADTRINQLNDAKYEYMKTREYRRKPELPPKSLRRRPDEGRLETRPKLCTRTMRSSRQKGGYVQ